MADTVTLREYLDELDMLLENESPTEVVSHCRYILQHFPHNVETYRLLGKALLQKGHHEGLKEHFDEAAEVFLRVLSVLPNDHITHLGLSEIREHDDDLDQAIWHLERAYEQLPGNAVLQEALRDLYARRDGEDNVPEKIQLTRSALARQFANNKLYEQALIELRAAIAHAPQRADLHVLLAEMLWESGHPVEAGEAAVQVLKKLPNSMAANKIMASLWLDYERPTDAQVFLDRLESLDPYEAARLIQPDIDVPDPNRLPRLDYSAKATAELSAETPAWVHDLDEFGDSAAMEDLFLAPSDIGSRGPESPPSPETIDTDAIFGMSYETDDQDDWMGEPATDSGAPDWFSGMNFDAGPEPEAPAAPDEWQPAAFAEMPGEAETGEDVPDWFAEMASVQPLDQALPEDDWLGQSDDDAQGAMGSPLSDETDLEEIAADWLSGADESDEQAELGAWEQQGAPDDATGDWPVPTDQAGMGEDTFPAPEGLGEEGPVQDALAPDWLMDDDQTEPVAADAGLGTGQAVVDTQDTGEDDWLAALEARPLDAQPTAEPLAPDWLAEPRPSDEAPEIAFASSKQASADVQPGSSGDWLDALREAGDEDLFTLEDDQDDVDSWLAADDGALEWAESEDEVSRGFSDFLSEIEETRQAEDAVEPGGGVDMAPAQWPAPVEEDIESAVGEALPDEATPVLEEDATGGEWADTTERAPDTAGTSPEEESETDWWSALREESSLSDEPTDDALPADFEDSEAEATGGDLDELMGRADSAGEPVSSIEQPPEWMTEPEYDFFAPAPEGDVLSAAQPEEDWIGTLNEVGSSVQADADGEAPPEGLSWLETDAGNADDDWLRSFAVEPADSELEPEAEEFSATEQQAEPALWQDDQQDIEEVPTASAEEEAAWLDDLSEVENLPDEDRYEPVYDASGRPELAGEAETQGEPESADADILSALSAASLETTDPAWLADIEPIDAPADEFDPFALETAEDDVEYRSAGDTGVLQPDELPDWMTAFTGDELPEDDLSSEPEAGVRDEFSAGSTGEQPDESPSITESLAGLTFDEDDYAAPVDGDVSESEENEAGDVEEETGEGVMPEWLMAITSSEADKLDDLLLDEPEPYSQTAEETGILQPGTTPDWLVDISDAQDAEEGLHEPETGFDAFAQPDDLAHTMVVESGVDVTGIEDEDEIDEMESGEAIPADFSFDDQPPAWLRRPKEDDLASPQQAPQDRTSQMPEWLRDVMEEDDETIE